VNCSIGSSGSNRNGFLWKLHRRRKSVHAGINSF
jgi:hypothetical protein